MEQRTSRLIRSFTCASTSTLVTTYTLQNVRRLLRRLLKKNNRNDINSNNGKNYVRIGKSNVDIAVWYSYKYHSSEFVNQQNYALRGMSQSLDGVQNKAVDRMTPLRGKQSTAGWKTSVPNRGV